MRPLRGALETVRDLLSQGITPEKISLAIALAAVIGVFPVLGTTTLLCAGASVVFGLNPAAMQLVGWVVYPLQLTLLVPLMRLGTRLFGFTAVPALSVLLQMMRSNLWGAIKTFWPCTLSAIGAWLLLAPFVIAALYFSLLPPLRRMRGTPRHT